MIRLIILYLISKEIYQLKEYNFNLNKEII